MATATARPLRVGTFLEFVKIEHTLFALPFVLAGMVLGFVSAGLPFAPSPEGLRILVLVLVAATGARTLGMTLNRIVDRAIDAKNPRTARRALPAGDMRLPVAVAIALVSGAALVVAASVLNPLCLALSPILVLLFFAYPYAKRATPLCHFVLGLAFLCAPMGGYLAVTGAFAAGWTHAAILGIAAMLWVTGFDVVYALLDVAFDRQHRIFSLPAAVGEGLALRVAAALHALTVVILLAFAAVASLAWPAFVAIAAVAVLLVHEHRTVDPGDPVAINKAFFHVNAVVGWVVLAGVVAGLLV